MKKVSIIYHFDDDGKCAAAVVALILGEKYKTEENGLDINYILASDYEKGREYIDATRSDDDFVIIVDFSVIPKDMDYLIHKIGKNKIIWIDHHETAIKMYEGYHTEINGKRYFNKENPLAGCELAWMYFTNDCGTIFDNSSVPAFIEYIGAYDTWRYTKRDDAESVLKFHYGLDGEFRSPNAFLEFFKNDMITWIPEIEYPCNGDKPQRHIGYYVEKGSHILEFKQNMVRKNVRNFGYEMEFCGHKAFVLNGNDFSSLAFGEKIKEYDICIAYAFLGDHYTVSVYTDHDRTGIYVNRICEKFAYKGRFGGGHPGAAGFKTENNIFIKNI